MDQLALGLMIALVPLMLAGLSYVTFMHPKLARKLLGVLIILDIIYFSGVYSAEFGAVQGYNKSLDVIASDTVIAYNPLDQITTGRMDSLKVYMSIQANANAQLYNTILSERENDLQYTQRIRLYCYIAFAIFIIFFILSFLFETMKLSEKLNTKTKNSELNRFFDR